MKDTELKAAFGKFVTGVTIVTTQIEPNKYVGFTANSFTSVSIDPPLLLICLGKQLSSFSHFEKAPSFCVSILNENQADIASIFATSKEDRFSQVDYALDDLGNPYIKDAAAHFSCTSYEKTMAGDHMLLIGKVETCATSKRKGLAYVEKQFFKLS